MACAHPRPQGRAHAGLHVPRNPARTYDGTGMTAREQVTEDLTDAVTEAGEHAYVPMQVAALNRLLDFCDQDKAMAEILRLRAELAARPPLPDGDGYLGLTWTSQIRRLGAATVYGHDPKDGGRPVSIGVLRNTSGIPDADLVRVIALTLGSLPADVGALMSGAHTRPQDQH